MQTCSEATGAQRVIAAHLHPDHLDDRAVEGEDPRRARRRRSIFDRDVLEVQHRVWAGQARVLNGDARARACCGRVLHGQPTDSGTVVGNANSSPGVLAVDEGGIYPGAGDSDVDGEVVDHKRPGTDVSAGGDLNGVAVAGVIESRLDGAVRRGGAVTGCVAAGRDSQNVDEAGDGGVRCWGESDQQRAGDEHGKHYGTSTRHLFPPVCAGSGEEYI